MTIDGLITVRSSFEHSETLVRFEAGVRANGLRVVAAVDHAIAAFEAGLSLDATTVQMVGDGRLQARADESSSIDRPRAAFKVPVWQDALRDLVVIYRFSVACEALRSRARGRVPYHGHCSDDRRHARKAGSPP